MTRNSPSRRSSFPWFNRMIQAKPRRSSLRAEAAASRRIDRSRPLALERLEERTLLAVVPTFTGPIALSVAPLVNISRAGGNQTEGTIAVDPTSPNRVFAVSNPGSSAGISTNAGGSFTTFNSDAGLLTPPDGSCCDNDSAWDNFGNLFNVFIGVGPDGTIPPGGDADDTILWS